MVLTSLVAEKESNLRIMMKIHGLDDRLYWVISYTYFVLEFVIYMLCLVAFASVLGKAPTHWLFLFFFFFLFYFDLSPSCLNAINFFTGLQFFTMNDFKIQFLFYFIGINLQISMAFLMAPILSNVKMITGLLIVNRCSLWWKV